MVLNLSLEDRIGLQEGFKWMKHLIEASRIYERALEEMDSNSQLEVVPELDSQLDVVPEGASGSQVEVVPEGASGSRHPILMDVDDDPMASFYREEGATNSVAAAAAVRYQAPQVLPDLQVLPPRPHQIPDIPAYIYETWGIIISGYTPPDNA